MDPSLLPLRSHPVISGVDFGPSPHQIGSIGYAQPPPGKGPPRSYRPSLENANKPLPEIPTVPILGFNDIYKEPMENHAPEDSRPHLYPPPAWSTANIPPWSTATRPLSDIRELTEPSLVEYINRKPEPSLTHKRSSTRRPSLARKLSLRAQNHPIVEHYAGDDKRGRSSPVVSPRSDAGGSSVYSIPMGSVPPRSSSKPRKKPSISLARAPSVGPAPPRGTGYTIPNRGHSRSPVKEVAARLNAVTSDQSRRIPSRTFVRTQQPSDILEFPTHRHPRVALEFQVGASLFVGGGSIEGNVRLVIDEAERIRNKRALAIARVSVDLLGVEETSPPTRRCIFLNLATELIDSEHPPPHGMVESLKQISPIDPFWLLTPSTTCLPFMLSLPLDVGPPPFQSKHARIRYVLCVTILIRDQGRQYLVRTSQEITVLSVYDPEKALMSLPSPLTASDEYIKSREDHLDIVRMTAGLHRQVWVSGTSIFVDVHIANNSRKTIKRLELQLERDILCYKHAAASTLEKSAGQARIFDSNERTIFNRNVLKYGTHGWNGVPAHSTDIRTCDLELPRGHATVKCGKYFEVRYFLNIIVSTTHTKIVTVQLPIVLIHMNSLDVVPNSVAQVAAAIEEKRGPRSPQRLRRQPSQSVQGRAFAAPRKQSLDRMRAEAEDLAHLGELLEKSPRKHQYKQQIRRVQSQFEYKYQTPPSNRKGRVLMDDGFEDIRAKLRHVRSHESNLAARSLQRSTSGSQRRRADSSAMGFREVDVEEDVEQLRLGRSTSRAGGHAGEISRAASRAESNASSFRSRLEAGRRRQFEFKKKKSKEGWMGISWWEKRKEREEKERQERKEMMDNWI